jgi:acetoin utilization deacetylase AcuC-like enzyme
MPKHNLYSSPAYTAAGYSFDSTRKPAWITESLQIDPIAGVTVVPPAPVSREEIESLHDPAYVQAIFTGTPLELAESNCFTWDSQVWTMVTAQNGGAIAAAISALNDGVSGSLSTGMHHAYRSKGKGFCTFNGLALSALAALRQGASNVLILDLDAHCGGGTHSLICDHERIWQIDVSVSNFDEHGDTPRSSVTFIKTPSRYLSFIEEELAACQGTPFGLCLYFSGMDPHEGCSFGGTPGFNDELLARREAMVFDWCRSQGIPVAYFVGGGYTGKRITQDHLVKLHRYTIAAAAR